MEHNRYWLIKDGQKIAESNFLLSLNGQIYDSFNKVYCNTHPGHFLLNDVFETDLMLKDIEISNGKIRKEQLKVSEVLSLVECIFNPKGIKILNWNYATTLFYVCLPYWFEVEGKKRMKKKIDQETGEVTEIYENEIEESINKHWDFQTQVNYLVKFKPKAVADCESGIELGVSDEVLQEAKNIFLGKPSKKKTWRDFYND